VSLQTDLYTPAVPNKKQTKTKKTKKNKKILGGGGSGNVADRIMRLLLHLFQLWENALKTGAVFAFIYTYI